VLAVVVSITALSLGGGNPGTNKLIAHHVATGGRGTVVGVKQSGGQLGVLVAGLMLPAIAVAASWRVSLVAGIVIPIVGLALLLTVVPPDRAGGGKAGVRSREAPFDSGVLWQIGSIGFAMGAGVSAVFGFLPLYAQEEVGMSSAAAGAVVALMAFVGVGARILWGRRSERVGHFSEPFAMLAVLSIGATAAIAAASTIGPAILWIGAAVAGASLEAWNSVGNMAVVTLIDLQHAGKASGLMMLGFLLGGALSPYAFGILVDSSGYGAAWTLVGVCFSAALIVALRWRRDQQGQQPIPDPAA
jgi:nitrate/nitrite transporter NarK